MTIEQYYKLPEVVQDEVVMCMMQSAFEDADEARRYCEHAKVCQKCLTKMAIMLCAFIESIQCKELFIEDESGNSNPFMN